MHPTSFLSLPPELRLDIYQLCLPKPGWTFVTDIPALCQVNRLIRHEALSVYYRLNNLSLELRSPQVKFDRMIAHWQEWLAFNHAKDMTAIKSFHLFFDVVAPNPALGTETGKGRSSSVNVEVKIAANWFAVRFLGPYDLSSSSWGSLDALIKSLLLDCAKDPWDGSTIPVIVDGIVKVTAKLECALPWVEKGKIPKRFVYERLATGVVESKHCWANSWGNHCFNNDCICPDHGQR